MGTTTRPRAMRQYALPVKPRKIRRTKRWHKVRAEHDRLVNQWVAYGVLTAEERQRWQGLGRWLDAVQSCWYHPILRKADRAVRRQAQLARLEGAQ